MEICYYTEKRDVNRVLLLPAEHVGLGSSKIGRGSAFELVMGLWSLLMGRPENRRRPQKKLHETTTDHGRAKYKLFYSIWTKPFAFM